MNECAVWYWSHGSIYYTLCRDEHEAALVAHDISDDDRGAPAGIQRSDGSYTPKEKWDEYKAESERRIQRAYDAVRQTRSQPAPVRRKILPPWDDDREVLVDGDAPAWLGRRP